MTRFAAVVAVLLVMSSCSGGGDPIASPVPVPLAIEESVGPALPATPTTSSTTTVAMPTAIPEAALDRSSSSAIVRMEADLEVLVSNGPRIAGTSSEAAALTAFADWAEEITDIVPAVQPVPLPNRTESANVWVGPIGSGDTVVLVGGHIDSVADSPGVDDNGSGIVVLLELLRRIVEDPPEHLAVVVVAFGAEEFVPGFDHHYGSDLAAADMTRLGTLPDLMMSVDMIGVGPTLYSVAYRGADHSFAEHLVDVSAEAGFDLVLRSRGDISDHVPFARAGVPSVLLLRGDNPAWHTAADDHVDMSGLVEALAVIEALIESLAMPAVG